MSNSAVYIVTIGLIYWLHWRHTIWLFNHDQPHGQLSTIEVCQC